jgi:inositol transport system ATP-binding protein
VTDALLEMRRVSKSFPGVRALDQVSFSVGRGEVVGLLGENGAGKSTLMKILAGVYRADAGEIEWDGAGTAFRSIREAQEAGVTLIFQELSNCPNMTAIENLFLGREIFKGRSPFLDLTAMRRKALELFEYLGVRIDLDVEVRLLSTAVQQMIEIAKALLTNVKLLVMDEPTSSLSDRETSRLFKVIRDLKERGISAVFISHKLSEVFEITDRIVVLRDGRNAGELDGKTGTMEELINRMVGRELGSRAARATSAAPGPEVLRVEGLSGPAVKDVSFTLRKGEILGFAGLIGAGRTEMARILVGAAEKRSGRILLEGVEARIGSPRDAVALGIAYLPEDRKVQALVLRMNVRENLTLAVHRVLLRFRAFLSRTKEEEITDAYVSSLRIRIASREQVVNDLSGGNQQKVVIAKWLATRPRILILDEPTRGIDVAAKAEVHRIVSDLAAQGVSIILISSELPEILALSDRVLVMHEGRVKTVLEKDQATQETIMSAALVADGVVVRS